MIQLLNTKYFLKTKIAKRGKLDKLPNVICYAKINQSREEREKEAKKLKILSQLLELSDKPFDVS